MSPWTAIIKKQFIRGITILLTWGLDSTEGQSLDSWQKVLNYSIEVSERSKNNLDVQALFAGGALAAIRHCGDKKQLGLMQQVFDFLYSIGQRYPDNKLIQVALAGGCSNAINGYSDAGGFEKLIGVFKILEGVERKYPQNISENETVKHIYVSGGVNAIKAYFNELILIISLVDF